MRRLATAAWSMNAEGKLGAVTAQASVMFHQLIAASTATTVLYA